MPTRKDQHKGTHVQFGFEDFDQRSEVVVKERRAGQHRALKAALDRDVGLHFGGRLCATTPAVKGKKWGWTTRLLTGCLVSA
jgi:hypothetical protein